MKAMKVIIAVLVVVILGLVYWSSQQFEKNSYLERDLYKRKKIFILLQKENKRLRSLYKQQLKEIAEYRIKIGGWNGPGWYKLKVTRYNFPNCSGVPTSIAINCCYLKSAPQQDFNNGTSSARRVIVGFGPYKTKDECLIGLNTQQGRKIATN